MDAMERRYNHGRFAVNAKDIKQLLYNRYSKGDAQAIAFEVAYGTGRHANRHVDAIVMDLWPSRGLTLHAMEIKVSKSDLKRELENGSKAEEVAQHCDLFSIVAPLGITKVTLLPAAWGLIEITKSNSFKFTKAAVKTKARVIDREFMAAMLRAVGKSKSLSDVEQKLKDARRQLYETFDLEVRTRSDQMVPDAKKWRELKGELGDKWYDDKSVIAAIRLVLNSGVDNAYNGLEQLHRNATAFTDQLGKAITQYKGEIK